jgi:hypothetical protein
VNTAHGPRNVGNSLAELDVEQMPAHLKREGQDWYVVFNPAVRRVLDVELVHTLPHASVVCCVRFSLDGRYVATGCNRLAQIYDVITGELVASLQDMQTNEDGDLYIRSVCFSPDGKYLATGAEDKIIRVWEISSAKIVHSFTGHEQDIYSLDFARNGRLIASGSGDRTVRLWDLDANRQVLQLLIDDGVTTVAISPDNRYVAAGSLDKSVRVWDVSGHIAERLEGEYGHRDSVYSVAFAPSGTELVSGSLDKTIKMWELGGQSVRPGPRTGRCIRTFEGHRVRLEVHSFLNTMLTIHHRTLFSALLLPLMAPGFSVDLKIGVSSSGILTLELPCSCFKATRTLVSCLYLSYLVQSLLYHTNLILQSSLLPPVLLENCLLLVVAISEQESGGMSVVKIPTVLHPSSPNSTLCSDRIQNG